MVRPRNPGITLAERRAAARARVTADTKRGVATPLWIIELAKDASRETEGQRQWITPVSSK